MTTAAPLKSAVVTLEENSAIGVATAEPSVATTCEQLAQVDFKHSPSCTELEPVHELADEEANYLSKSPKN